jgi:hypothetical protein
VGHHVGKKRFGIFFKQHRVKVNSVLLQKRRASIFPRTTKRKRGARKVPFKIAISLLIVLFYSVFNSMF